MNQFKHYFFTFLVSSFVLIVGHFSSLIYIDPVNVSRFELSKNEFFIKEMRFQSAGIINKYKFDSAIVGTSMAENFNANESSDKLGGFFKNLSLTGSLLKERNIILSYFLSQKNVKTIIISIDGVSTVQRNRGIPINAWSFLYNSNHLDDFSLYLNRKYSPYISCHTTFKSKLSNLVFGECPAHKIESEIEDLTEWQSAPSHNSRFGGIEKWLKHRENVQVSKSIEDINIASDLIQRKELHVDIEPEKLFDPAEFSKNITPLIKKYPQTRFILFFPPYSIFKYAIDAQTKLNVFSQYKDLVESVVLETEIHPNAEVYWFGDKGFISDLANYKDLTHYKSFYNSVFLDHFHHKTSIINVKNYKELLNDLTNKANAVDLVGFSKIFK